MSKIEKEKFIKNMKAFLIKRRIPMLVIATLALLACITFAISYAYYQVTDTESIVGGTVGDIPDLEIRIMVEERDANGNGVGTYSEYAYIPQAGYKYNENESFCTNGSALEYNSTDYTVTVTANNHDLCYAYFDSTASLDITLNVYLEDIDANGEGVGTYTKLETSSIPSVGYVLNEEHSDGGCDNNATLSYNSETNQFAIEASGKTVCNAYMDAMDVDIAVVVKIQAKEGSSVYYEASEIPTNAYYTLNSKSICTGSGGATVMSLENQQVVISTPYKTQCVAYLDVTDGPIVESASYEDGVLALSDYSGGTPISTYYYSTDGGETYNKSDSSSISVGDAESITVYGIDNSGNESAIVELNDDYVYNGIFDYASQVQTKTIEQSGYYELEVWGAEGGSNDANIAPGGAGGYSVGTVYLNAGDVLYVYTGGKGSVNNNSAYDSQGGNGVNGGGAAGYRGGGGGGATDIRINSDSLYARVIVAGGGGGAYVYNENIFASGGAGGGNNAVVGNYYNEKYKALIGGAGTQTSGGAGGTGTTSDYSGTNGEFGQGGSTGLKYDNSSIYSSGAGGGGWYGGGAAGNYNGNDPKRGAGGGGGSGYIYNESTASNYPNTLLNSQYYLLNALTYAGNVDFESPLNISETGHQGNGYAKVTYIGQTLE